MLRIVVVGGGFAGVFAALAAARERLRGGPDADVTIELVTAQDFLTIRPRLYEADLLSTRVPLDRVLEPVGVSVRQAWVEEIDPIRQSLAVRSADGSKASVEYDSLVVASGSAAVPPPGWHGVHHVDTWSGSQALQTHLEQVLQDDGDAAGCTAIVVGAGFTGIEVATELAARARLAASKSRLRVVLVDRAKDVAPEFGPNARLLIEHALATQAVEFIAGQAVATVSADGLVELSDGQVLQARTVIWTGGPRASGLAAAFGGPVDALGRISVDRHLAVPGAENIFAAGDIAAAEACEGQAAPMSCQHAMPQGRVAGHNAVRSARRQDLATYEQPLYVTCLDLGAAGALLTTGFSRDFVIADGAEAKAVKRMINRSAIYPPLAGDRDLLLEAGRISPAGGRVDVARQWAQGLLRLAKEGSVPDRAAQLERETAAL